MLQAEEDGTLFKGQGSKLHSFSIGLEGAPDLAAAQEVADFVGTEHHSFTFTAQEGIDALRDVVYYIESYEQLRASVPMYILSRKIKALGFKVRPTICTAVLSNR